MTRALLALPALGVVALAGSACLGSGTDADDAAIPDAAVEFDAPICFSPETIALEDNAATGGKVGCLDVGLRSGGGCPAILNRGLCAPSISIDEIASFVALSAGGYRVLMRTTVTATSHGTIESDGRTVDNLDDGDDITIASAKTDGTRIRIGFRFGGDSVTLLSVDHEDPF